jgi:hypothetical protein
VNLPEFAQIEEENERLRDQLVDLENEKNDEIAALKAEINELKAQLSAKEEFATAHPQIEERDGYTWQRTVTVTAPEWEQLPGVGA